MAIGTQATFTDVQYQLMRVYRNRNYIADLSFGQDVLLGLFKKKTIKVIGGQADMVPVGFDGAGVPSNVEGTTGTATPSQGVQFAVTPVPMTNLAALSALAAASGVSSIGAIVKPLRREIDQAIRKVTKVAAIELWQDGFPALATVVSAGASTTLTLGDLTATGVADKDFASFFSVGDVLVFAAVRNSGALRAGNLTVQKVNQNAGTLVVSANVNGVASSNDFIFLANTRITAGTKVAITGVQGWLPSAGAAGFFGVDTTQDDRLIGMQQAASVGDIEGAFVDGIARCLIFSTKGAENLTAFMHPSVWAILAKAMQSKTIVISPYNKKAREGEISFNGWKVSTPNGTIEVFTSMFCPKLKIFMLNMDTWELVSWGVDFPGIVAPQIGVGPPIFMDPTTGNISAMVGGFPQLECNAPGWNLTITLS